MPKHLYSLDVARGVAALSVVLWHWSHFYEPGGAAVSYVREEQPFYGLLFLFYERGALAVDFFFSLSGFVFFWLYGGKLTQREVGGWKFFVLRFSRLYPLHFLTLLATAAIAWSSLRLVEGFIACPNNDLYHFVLQLGFASHWGLQAGHSFNIPIWSVSIEILLYGLFFALCRLRWIGLWQVVVAILLGFVIKEFVYGPLGRGVFSFFVGGFCYHLIQRATAIQHLRKARLFLYGLTVSAWIFALGSTALELGTRLVENLPPLAEQGPLATKLIDKLAYYYGAGILFPLSILTLVTLERERGSLGKRLSFIGDVSYSSYLLHYPLQLVLMLVLLWQGWSFSFFASPLSLLLFYLLLLPASLLSFHWFERPCQRFLRSRLLEKTPTQGFKKN